MQACVQARPFLLESARAGVASWKFYRGARALLQRLRRRAALLPHFTRYRRPCWYLHREPVQRRGWEHCWEGRQWFQCSLPPYSNSWIGLTPAARVRSRSPTAASTVLALSASFATRSCTAAASSTRPWHTACGAWSAIISLSVCMIVLQRAQQHFQSFLS